MRPLMILPAALALAAAPAHGSGVGGGGSAAPVPMEPLRVPVVDAGRIAGRLDLQLMIQPDPHGAGDLAARMPVLRAAAVAELLAFANLEVSPRSPVDAAALAERLGNALHAADHRVTSVLLLEVIAHPA